MAKPLLFKIGSAEYSLQPEKLETSDLYGTKDKVVLDLNDSPCKVVSLLPELSMIIPKGGTALGSLDKDGNWVDKSNLKYVYADGSDAVLVPSSFKVPIELDKTVSIEEYLEHNITAIYSLQGENENQELVGHVKKQTEILTFVFNYRADYEGDPAFLIESGGNLFVLVGKRIEFEYIGLEEQGQLDVEEAEEEVEDEFDFSMF